MKNFSITILVTITRRQFVCDISADSEEKARTEALKDFDSQFPAFRAHRRILMCSEVLY